MTRFIYLLFFCFIFLRNVYSINLVMGITDVVYGFRLIGCSQNDSTLLIEDKNFNTYIASTGETFQTDGFFVTIVSEASDTLIYGNPSKNVYVEIIPDNSIARDSGLITFSYINEIHELSSTGSSSLGVQWVGIIDDQIILTLNSSDAKPDTIGILDTAVIRDSFSSYKFKYVQKMDFYYLNNSLVIAIQIRDLGYQITKVNKITNTVLKSNVLNINQTIEFQLNGRRINKKTSATYPRVHFSNSNKSVLIQFRQHVEE